MPNKRPSVTNEKQYEALKDKGMSKERAARSHFELAGIFEAGRTEVRIRQQPEARRHNRAEAGSRS